MKRLTLAALISLCFGALNAQDIMTNQIGFYPQSHKTALTNILDENEFSIIDCKTGETALEGRLSDIKKHDGTQSLMRNADFSELKKEGNYYIKIGNHKSYSFCIKPNVWKETAYALIKSYYYQRCSMELEEKYAGQWARKAGHPDTKCLVHPSAKSDRKFISSPGGWYDAGDYGKYVVNAGITTATLLYIAEYYPEIFPDGSLNIPESGNGINDLLDEIRYELEWLSTMQDTDGGVFFKITSKNFCGTVMPEDDNMKRFVIGKSTTSALNFSAVMAVAARVYEETDKDFAGQCLSQAEKAWKWATSNEITAFTNPDDIKTGEYGDKRMEDEFVWAASELYITTQADIYRKYVSENINKLNIWKSKFQTSTPGWANTDMLAIISLASNENAEPFNKRCARHIEQSAKGILNEIANNVGRIPDMKYNWGSNSEMANKGWILLVAARIAQNKEFVKAAAEIGDYLLGKNPLGKSFITGIGQNHVMNSHHRISSADGIKEPVPGLIAGGPNGKMNDANTVRYSNSTPAMAYMDVEASYASNEVAINWNAPATALFAITDYLSKSKSQKASNEFSF